jgi:two-component system sensor histidine kinase KdpD
VAEGVEVKRLAPTPITRRREEGSVRGAVPQAISERLLALVTLSPRAQRVVRRAWRSAQRLGGELDLLVVRPPGRDSSADEREQLEALRRLASVLGAHLLLEEGDDVAEVAIRVARERGSTYVLMGAPKPRNAWRRLTQPALPFRLLRGLPGVDLRIVADRTLRDEGLPVQERLP